MAVCNNKNTFQLQNTLNQPKTTKKPQFLKKCNKANQKKKTNKQKCIEIVFFFVPICRENFSIFFFGLTIVVITNGKFE